MRLVWLALVASSLPLAAQSTIRVPADAPAIQGAIDLAEDGDTVLVAPGRTSAWSISWAKRSRCAARRAPRARSSTGRTAPSCPPERALDLVFGN